MEELTNDVLQWASENTEVKSDKEYLYFDVVLSTEQLIAIYNITE